MGEVWRAEHIKLASPVAIKVLPTSVAQEPKRSARFMREAQAAAAIRSTNVVHVLDYGVEDGIAYIAMEYLEGESLDGRLDYTGRLTPVETLNVVVQVAKAIGRAHKRGIVHRDLKPANIFIADEDEGEVVKVLDFGIAKLVHQDKKPDDTTVTGTVLGTPYYMSPEQARAHKVVDHRTDLWALGIIAFECITGERPVDGASVGDIISKICSLDMPKPSQLNPVPVGFDAWFRKATSRDPDDRFQSAREMATTLRDLMVDDGSLSLTSSRDSLESIDPLRGSGPGERAELAMLDTLAARRQLSQPPGPISDSWDSTGDDISIDGLPSSESFADVHEAQTIEHAPKGASKSDETANEELDSNSIRVSGALARSNDPPARNQRGVLAAIALFVATLSGAAVLGLTRDDPSAENGPEPATSVEHAVHGVGTSGGWRAVVT
ncbi:MAG: serine/threonine-protein kinase, partial [Myxococcota bacterium]